MFYIYIIKSEECRFYIGSTKDIPKRLDQHNNKTFGGWTARYNNWSLVHSEELQSRTDALIREKQIKSYKGGAAFKKLISSTLGS